MAKFCSSTTLFLLFAIALGISQPISNSGACPALTRYTDNSGANWGSFPIQPNPQSSFPTGTIQNPLTPAQSVNCVRTPSGLQAQVIASEAITGCNPAPHYMMYFDFDERGRAWVVDSRDYPNTIGTNRATGGQGRILILEDTDGDGALNSCRVFYSGLVIPTSLVVARGGVVATAYPNIYFIPNTNDVGGTAQALFTGTTGTGNYDSHGQINSLMWGLDNWIYGHTGYDGCNISGVDCGNGRTWRFKHTTIGHSTTSFQSWTTGPQNAHGIGMMENGEIFQSGATLSVYSGHSIRRGVASVGLVNVNSSFYPVTGDLFLWEGANNGTSRSSAVSGHDFYNARLLPATYNNRLYVCEGATKLCHQDNLAVNVNGGNTGSTWAVTRMTGAGSNIIEATDAWFAPLKVRTGPDGGLWVLDWYNYLFLHNPASPSGAGGAWCQSNNCSTPGGLRTKSRSRIYRMIPSSGATQPYLNLGTASETQVIAALANTNMMWRMQAQRELIDRGFTASLGTALENILNTQVAADAMGNDPAATHAVWVLEGLGQFTSNAARWDPVLRTALLNASWATRRNILMAMPRTAATSQSVSDQCMVNDDHGHVRLQALVAHVESPNVTGERAIWTTFQNVDGSATSAVTAAGIGTSGTRPCTPTLGLPTRNTSINPGRVSQPRFAPRFIVTRDGFTLPAHGQLATGELVVYDLRGHAAFRSSFNQSTMEWSSREAKGLTQSVYYYVYRPADGGETMKGSIPLTSNF